MRRREPVPRVQAASTGGPDPRPQGDHWPSSLDRGEEHSAPARGHAGVHGDGSGPARVGEVVRRTRTSSRGRWASRRRSCCSSPTARRRGAPRTCCASLPEQLAEHTRGETHGLALELATDPHATVAEAATRAAPHARRPGRDRARRSACAPRSPARIRWCAPRTSRSRPAPATSTCTQSLRELARREPTFALHVHVAVPDPELAVRAYNGMRAHIPVLLALAANSPFTRGRDSGLASARTPVFQAFPRTGIPREFGQLRRVRRGDRRADPLRRDPRADVHLVGRAPAAASSARSRCG